MAWRVVNSLIALRDQINAACPGRAKGADGTIGDVVHQSESNSDHNPHAYPSLGSTPVVCALDITHDPAHGCDTYTMADVIRASRDPRVAYIISNRRIASNHAVGPTPAWAWRAYTGTGDPHTGHMHISTVHTATADGTQPWTFHGGTPTPTPSPVTAWKDPDMFLVRPASGAACYLADNAGHKTLVDMPLLTYLRSVGIPFCDGIADSYATQMMTFGVQAAPAATVTDAQIQAIADKLVASAANGLTAADHAGIAADLKQALREGTS